MNPIFDEQAFMHVKTCAKLRRYLIQRQRVAKSVAFNAVGRGLNGIEFDGCITTLVQAALCRVEKGERGAEYLVINPNWQKIIAEQIIAHAVECAQATR